MQNRVLLFLRTIRHLQAKQLWYQLYYRIRRPTVRRRKLQSIRPKNSEWTPAIIRPRTHIGGNVFEFLNQKNTVDLSTWDTGFASRLWSYNLHYFDYINSKIDEDLSRYFIESWIENVQDNTRSAWEPYTISLRLVNWIKWYFSAKTIPDDFADSIATQASVLRSNLEFHILANHLFANAKALIFAGAVIKSKEADEWFDKGVSILQDELNEQFLKDGAHYELSPMYHSILLEDLLDLLNLFQTIQRDSCKLDVLKKKIEDIVPSCFRWLSKMTHANGELSYFNDSVAGIAADYAALKDYYERCGYKLGEVSNYEIANLSDDNLLTSIFCDSGFARVQTPYYCILINLSNGGPKYQKGHSHADFLSYEVSNLYSKVIVNTGISTYDDNATREKERSAKSHNTVLIDERNPLELWAAFRVARRSSISDLKIKTSNDLVTITGTVLLYWSKGKGSFHKRTWELSSKQICITDKLGPDVKHACASTHFHPDLIQTVRSKQESIFSHQSRTARCVIRSTGSINNQERYNYCLGFGKVKTGIVIRNDLSSTNSNQLKISFS